MYRPIEKILIKMLNLRHIIVLLFIFSGNCELEKTRVFSSKNLPPTRQEFRWSNGKPAKSFDPAKASSPPETDIVRAIFKGLTDVNPQSLEPMPAVAVHWVSSEDYRTWTFYLRKDAIWTNGERVVAQDFVRSWQRVLSLKEKSPNRKLLRNIVGFDDESISMQEDGSQSSSKHGAVLSPKSEADGSEAVKSPGNPSEMNKSEEDRLQTKRASGDRRLNSGDKSTSIGLKILDDFTLEVNLVTPDPQFPLLVSNPVFYPVYDCGTEFEIDELNSAITTNGTFRITSVGIDGITLDKNEKYWDKAKVRLDRVKIIPVQSEDEGLKRYEEGEFDVLTNVELSPTLLKLLESYADFFKTTHAAVNFYQFNLSKPPFDDRRVREALAIAINRRSITEDELGGTAVPAYSFSPFGKLRLVEDIERAKMLLKEAGFSDTENFPIVRLLINRNDTQRRIAKAIAKMWQKNLGIKTEIVSKDAAEFENAFLSGEFDLVRRGVVFPTKDEVANMMLMFEDHMSLNNTSSENASEREPQDIIGEKTPNKIGTGRFDKQVIKNEQEAFKILPAIPIHFPISFALVKPHVRGFVLNSFDSPSLEQIWIDTDWREIKKDEPNS